MEMNGTCIKYSIDVAINSNLCESQGTTVKVKTNRMAAGNLGEGEINMFFFANRLRN